ncbi:hypothetical protein KAW18_19110, partial [candidate division WOR-3 bacterium]|nr:hypothetical protein [candidate division WOR-3 bacterium]
MNKTKIAFGIVLVALAIAVVTTPAMAREDDCVFQWNAADGTELHEITVAPGDEVTVYLNLDAPINKTSTFQAAVVYDPDVVEFVDVTENESVTNWYMWDYKPLCGGPYPATGDRVYNWFKTWDIMGVGPDVLRCGDITFKARNPGMTTIYLGKWPDDITVKDNRTLVGDMAGDPKNWTTETLTFTCTGEVPPETFSKPLVAGWNLISLPLTNDTDMTVANIIDTSLSGNYSELHKYDTTTHSFVSLSSSDTMENGVGYFIHMTADDTWTYSGSAYTSMSVSLSEGLNMVGWLNCS